jgi:hypothetical protein
VQREITLLDEGVVAIVDRWDADQAMPVSLTFVLHPAMESGGERGLASSAGGQISYLSAAVHAADTIPLRLRQIPYSPSYGSLGHTQALHGDLQPARRGACVTFFSRAGSIRMGARPGEFYVAGTAQLEIRIGPNGLTARRGMPTRVNGEFVNHSIESLRAR